MVYLDSSVAIAHIGAEEHVPPERLWDESLVSSRLLEYETLCRVNAAGRGASHGDVARELIRRVALIDLIEPVVSRATQPFSVPVRTLDALHLASMAFLLEQGVPLSLASYDRRLTEAAATLGIGPYPL
jgi:predicted nucleic acid-binding protein